MCQMMEATSADLESWVGKEEKVDSGEAPVEVKSMSESGESGQRSRGQGTKS